MRHSTQCPHIVLFTPHPEHWMTFTASRADADHALPTGDRRRKRAHVRAEEAGHLDDQMGTTQERNKQGLPAKGTYGTSPEHHQGHQVPNAEALWLNSNMSLEDLFLQCPTRRLTKTPPSDIPQTSQREQTLSVNKNDCDIGSSTPNSPANCSETCRPKNMAVQPRQHEMLWEVVMHALWQRHCAQIAHHTHVAYFCTHS